MIIPEKCTKYPRKPGKLPKTPLIIYRKASRAGRGGVPDSDNRGDFQLIPLCTPLVNMHFYRIHKQTVSCLLKEFNFPRYNLGYKVY